MKYSNSEKQKILKKQIKVAAVSEFQSLCKSESCHLFGYLVLFPLDVADEFLNFCNLGIEHLLEELRCQLLGDGKFIGSFDGLVEVASKPAEAGTCGKGRSSGSMRRYGLVWRCRRTV